MLRVIRAAVHTRISAITTILVRGWLLEYSTLISRKGRLNFSMVITSGHSPEMPAITPVYCTPFSQICKQFFHKCENFFTNSGYSPPKSADFCPNMLPQWTKHPAQGPLPANSPPKSRRKVAQPGISQANGKAVIDPGPQQRRQKQKIRQPGSAPGQGPEEAEQTPQSGPQSQGPETAGPGCCRCGHRNRRPSTPRSLGSSKIRALICPSTAARLPSRDRS